jgi:apolipoprotein D and lipocalin family protein
MNTWLIVLLVFVGLLILLLFYVNYGRWHIDSNMLAKNFKIKEFLEKPWHQYAFIPNRFQKKCVSDTKATYTRKSNGDINISNTCKTKDGKTTTVHGEGYIYGLSKLKVSFLPKALSYIDKFLQIFGDINLFTADYYVLSTDNINYAMIGTSNIDYLWIVVRDPDYFTIKENQSHYKRLVALAADRGYPVAELVTSS